MALIDKASLLMVPSVYEDGTLYNVLPSGNKAPDETGNHNGYDQTRADFTFSRGSNLAATRVNADGLIEKGRENLLLQSNNFDTTWGDDGGTIASGFEGYDGTNNAWKYTKTGQFDGINQSGLSITGVHTISVYAKLPDGETDVDSLLFRIDYSGGNTNIVFALDDDSVPTASGNGIHAKKESVGNGWYRCSLALNQSTTKVNFRPSLGSSTSGTSGSIFIQNSQAELGLVSTPYIETGATTATAGVLENTPRIDYSSGAGALLLEPSRTNTLPHSEYLDAYAFARTDGTQNAATSPEGVNNAFKLFATATTGAHYMRLNYTKTVGAVLSVFAKKGEETAFAIGNATGSQAVVFNLEDGTITSESGGTGTIEDYGSGWYRCSYYRTAWADWQYISLRGNNTTYTGDGSSGIYLYGLQFEDGTYMSSLIPTHGAAVTRGADSCSVTGVSDVIGQSEGTMYVEADLSKVPGENRRFFAIGDGTVSNRIGIGQQSGKSLEAFVVSSGSLQAIFTHSGTSEQVYKIAIAYKANDFAFYINGSQVGTDTSGSVPSVGNVYLGVSEITPTTTQISDGIKQAALFNERLSNTELATLTTL